MNEYTKIIMRRMENIRLLFYSGLVMTEDDDGSVGRASRLTVMSNGLKHHLGFIFISFP